MSPTENYSNHALKHCADKELDFRKLTKKLFFGFSTLVFSFLSILLFVWLILHPSKPRFSLSNIDVYQLSLSGPHLLNSSFQVTIASENPNQKVGIYYDEIQAYACYKEQQVTVSTPLPPFYQGHGDSNHLTALLYGSYVPVASSFSYDMGLDQANGKLQVSVKLTGRLRWKVGSWVSGHSRFNVDCDAVMGFNANAVSAPLSSQPGTRCSTTV